MNALNEGIGINCKTLLLFFWALIAIKLVTSADFIDPAVLLADGSEMTQLAVWMWKYALVVMGELLLGLGYSVLFEDGRPRARGTNHDDHVRCCCIVDPSCTEIYERLGRNSLRIQCSMGSIGLCDNFMQCGYCWWPLWKQKVPSIFRIPRN